jgi:hypothetical protein
MLVTIAALAFLTQGCIAAIALPLLKDGSPDKLSVASDRKDVKAELGKPIASESTPDGGRVDTYDYRRLDTADMHIAMFGLHRNAVQGLGYYALLNIVTYGALDLAISSYILYRGLTTIPRSRVKIAFGPDGRLAWIGSPPPYGPPDDAVEIPSIGAIRARCRPQDGYEPSNRTVGSNENLSPPEDLYVRCVVGGFAVWGIE